MDLEDGSFESKLTGEVETGETLGKMASLGEIRLEANVELDRTEEVPPIPSSFGARNGDRAGEGRCSVSPDQVSISFHGGDAEEIVELVGVGVGGALVADSSSSPVVSPLAAGDQAGTPVSAASKGYGLKKWRRIRRDVNKEETDPGADSTPIHKRRLPHVEPQKGHEETKNNSNSEDEGEGSVASVELRNPVGTPIMVSPALHMPINTELGRLAASGIGIDSDNSEDQSSKSSTAASAPRLWHEIGFGRERSMIRNVGGRGRGRAVQHKGQRSRGVTESGKKVRDHPIKIEKDSSYSSVESDTRSPDADFAKRSCVVSNGKKSETFVKNSEEHNDVAQCSEEVQSGYGKENVGTEYLSRENMNGDLLDDENINKNENRQADSYVDPLLESISSLQALQEALENEIQLFKQSGKDAMSDDSDDHFEESEEGSSPVFDGNLRELSQKIDQLEHKLEEASITLKVKETKVMALEATLRETQRKESEHNRLSALQQDFKELEAEFDKLLKEKIEAETDIFVTTRATQNWRILQADHDALQKELKILDMDRKKFELEVGIAESKANMIKLQNDEISKRQLEAKEISRLQNEVCKYSFCTFVQMVMLCIVFGLLFIRMLPSSSEFVVPT